MCGKKIAGRVGPKLPGKKSEHVGLLYAQFEELLNFLKAHGALLNVAKPEYFFSLENFQRYQTQRAAEQAKKGVRAFGHEAGQIKAIEQNWPEFSKMMWCGRAHPTQSPPGRAALFQTKKSLPFLGVLLPFNTCPA